MKKIGILGGSFDPIHEAHISLAHDAIKSCGLDKLIIVPAKLQPFKLDKKVSDASDRLEMVRLAAAGEPKIEVSDYEICSEGVSYSFLTMRHMQNIYPDAKLYFITGTDAFLMIEKWKNSDEMLDNYSYIIGTRPGYRQEELKACIRRIRNDHGTEINNIDNIQLDISSTQIRDAIACGRSVFGLIPESVDKYIKKKRLYK